MSGVAPVGLGGGTTGGLAERIMAMRQDLRARNDALRGGEVDAAVFLPPGQPAPSAIPPAGGTAAPFGQTGFGNALGDALGKVNHVQGEAARLSAAYERGEVTDIASVMVARQRAGIAFEATLQVRNKLLSAYQDIMRMGV